MTTANQAHDKTAQAAKYLDEFYRDTSIPNSTPLRSYEQMLEDSQCHPLLYAKVIVQIDEAYKNLKATMDETRWTLEHLNELTEAAQKDAQAAA